MEVSQPGLDFWNSRATLGAAAGTNDLLLKSLEIENISGLLSGCRRVLDAGCGNGITAISILRKFRDVHVHGFDYSEAMVEEARRLGDEEGVSTRLTVEVGDLKAPPFPERYFDAVYTERSLINLSGINEQRTAIAQLARKIKPGGRIILCESFVDGLDEINAFRVPVGLPAIDPPWHNQYLRMADLEEMLPTETKVQTVLNFSSTYYFLSRVINAWEARRDGIEPSYDAPINKLAFELPSIELCAQTKIVVLVEC